MEIISELLLSRWELWRGWLIAITIAILSFFDGLCFAQLPANSREDFAEMAAAQSQFSEQDWQDFEESLKNKSGIDVNTIEEDEMASWGVITPWQIQQFFAYRNQFGKFIHINELQAVPGWYPALIKILLPLLKVSQAPVFFENKKELRVQASLRTAGLPSFVSEADSSGRNWLGDNCRLLLQMRMEYAGLKMGFTAKKDPGEPLWRKGVQQGFGYYGFHAFWQGKRSIKTIAIGDYTVNLGQGLIHWQTMALRKSGELLWIKRQSQVVKPHRGGGEFNFHRGFAIQTQFRKWELTSFISLRKLTASLSYDSLDVPRSIGSIIVTGYHRTPSELESKNNVTEVIGGMRIAKHLRNFTWGINAVCYRYSLPFERGTSPYQLFKINGRSWQNASIDFSFTHKNAHWFGELAVDKFGKKALLAGLILSANAKLDFAMVLRALSKEYQALYASAFTESSSPSNEFGIFLTLSLRPTPQLQFNLYNDFYQFPWLRYQVSIPSMGRDHYIQATFQPSRNTFFSLRLRQEQKPEDPASSAVLSPYPPLVVPIKSSARFHLEKKVASQFQLLFRMEMLKVRYWSSSVQVLQMPVSETGYLCYWETRNNFSSIRAKCSFRIQYFDTDSYKSRIYSFLPDPGSSFSVSASYGHGFLVGAFFSKKLKNKWLINLSLLLKNTNKGGRVRCLPGAQVGWDL